MKKQVLTIMGCLLVAVNCSFAEMIRGINMDFVTIGRPGNPADTGGTVGRGAVNYEYRIGKYEITNAQWNAFIELAGVPTGNPPSLYNQNASYTGLQKPTNYVSWYEAAQFCNYLTTGDKSRGVYRFSGEFDGNGNSNPGNFLGVDRETAKTRYGIIYVIPTEDEWYKAAYYKPDGSGYSLYANGTSTAPAYYLTNYNNKIGQPWDVGSGGIEQNGTFDMLGNVSEWTENIYYDYYSRPFTYYRGGAWADNSSMLSSNNSRGFMFLDSGNMYNLGFRIVAIVPEPLSLTLLGLGGLILRQERFIA